MYAYVHIKAQTYILNSSLQDKTESLDRKAPEWIVMPQIVKEETGHKSGTAETKKKKNLVHSVLKYVYSIETSTRVK